MSNVPAPNGGTPTEKFSLEIRMDATITVFDKTGQAVTWLKPGSTAGHTWKGMPTPEEVKLRYNDLKEVASATLEDVVVTSHQTIKEGGYVK